MISLVTGSGTLLGNTISDFLLKKNFEVFCCYRNTIPLNLKKRKKAYLFKFDLKKTIKFKKKFNYLIHCAGAIPSENLSFNEYMKINVLGFKKILENSITNKCKKIILISSTSVYGKINTKYLTEKNILNNNVSDYAKSKIQMEKLLINYCKKNSINYLILRLPAIVGKNSQYNFISSLLKNIYIKKEITISNPNLKFNNLIHVTDVARIIYSYLRSEKKNLIFNVCSTYPMKLINICKFLKKILKKKNKINIKKNKTKGFRIKLNRHFLKKFDIMTTKKTLELLCKEIRYIS